MRPAALAWIALACCDRAPVTPPKQPPKPALEILDYDTSVGWERHIEFAPGETIKKRDPGSYAEVGMFLAEPKTEDIVLAQVGNALADKALIVKPVELCHATFQAVVAKHRPPRLLLRIDGTLDMAAAGCLARLATPRLYLAMCPDDGESLWRCDGDAELAVLAASAELVPKIVALAIGFGDPASWRHVRALDRLEYLLVRGKGIERGDADDLLAICARPALAYVDVLDPTRSSVLDDTDCAWNRLWYEGQNVPDPLPGAPCRLQHLMIWDEAAPRAAKLRAACPTLVEVDSMREAYHRLRGR